MIGDAPLHKLRDRLEAIRLAQHRLRGLPLELPEEVG
jgi:hypothetical protein